MSGITKKTGFDWFESIGSPRFVLSPMVGQSELPFRMLIRTRMHRLAAERGQAKSEGNVLCYTPMMIASSFATSESYRSQIYQTCKEDYPLVAQFCAVDPASFVAAAKQVEKDVVAVDLNLGCPQDTAKRNGYGSWMMEKQELIKAIVTKASTELSVPVTCKIRVFPTFKQTLEYVLMLQAAGASLVTIHGRQRHMREEVLADLEAANRLRTFLTIPVVYNGDIWAAEDQAIYFATSQVDAVMSAQGILHNPGLFESLLGHKLLPPRPPRMDTVDSSLKKKLQMLASSTSTFKFVAPGVNSRYRQRRSISPILTYSLTSIGKHPLNTEENVPRIPTQHAKFVACFDKSITTPEDAKLQFEIAKEYVDMCARYPVAHGSIARRHIFFMLFDNFQANLDIYDDLYVSDSVAEWRSVVERLEKRAMNGKSCKNPPPLCKATSKPRPTRRDASIAPPPWPTGGGALHVTETKPSKNNKKKYEEESSEDELEIVLENGKSKQNSKKTAKVNRQAKEDQINKKAKIDKKQDKKTWIENCKVDTKVMD